MRLTPGVHDVALALHACGNATDLALLQAQRHRMAFVVSPCCLVGARRGIVAEPEVWGTASATRSPGLARGPGVAPGQQ